MNTCAPEPGQLADWIHAWNRQSNEVSFSHGLVAQAARAIVYASLCHYLSLKGQLIHDLEILGISPAKAMDVS